MAEVCFTASVGRSHFSHRLAIVAESVAALRQSLINVLAGRAADNCWRSDDMNPEYNAVPDTLKALIMQYRQGNQVDWTKLYTQGAYRKLVLPTYPFQRQYYGPKRP